MIVRKIRRDDERAIAGAAVISNALPGATSVAGAIQGRAFYAGIHGLIQRVIGRDVKMRDIGPWVSISDRQGLPGRHPRIAAVAGFIDADAAAISPREDGVVDREVGRNRSLVGIGRHIGVAEGKIYSTVS